MQRKPSVIIARELFHDEKGASSVEYGLLVALITVVIMTSVRLLGRRIRRIFRYVARQIGS
jgi:pilus assembly protein Flp/PilA